MYTVITVLTALFGLLTAILVYLIHRNNRVDAVRAEISLHHWTVDRFDNRFHLVIADAFNFGKGPALSFGVQVREAASGRILDYDDIKRRWDLRSEGNEKSDFKVAVPLTLPNRSGPLENLAVRLFWTDLHKKKHLVEVSLVIDYKNTGLRPPGEYHVLSKADLSKELPRIYMTRRQADWYFWHQRFYDALDK